MNRIELKTMIALHDRELRRLQVIATHAGCKTCMHFGPKGCDRWGAEVPAEHQAAGCDEWCHDDVAPVERGPVSASPKAQIVWQKPHKLVTQAEWDALDDSIPF